MLMIAFLPNPWVAAGMEHGDHGTLSGSWAVDHAVGKAVDECPAEGTFNLVGRGIKTDAFHGFVDAGCEILFQMRAVLAKPLLGFGEVGLGAGQQYQG